MSTENTVDQTEPTKTVEQLQQELELERQKSKSFSGESASRRHEIKELKKQIAERDALIQDFSGEITEYADTLGLETDDTSEIRETVRNFLTSHAGDKNGKMDSSKELAQRNRKIRELQREREELLKDKQQVDTLQRQIKQTKVDNIINDIAMSNNVDRTKMSVFKAFITNEFGSLDNLSEYNGEYYIEADGKESRTLSDLINGVLQDDDYSFFIDKKISGMGSKAGGIHSHKIDPNSPEYDDYYDKNRESILSQRPKLE